MDILSKEQFIRACAIAGKIKWSAHALQELIPESLSVPEIEIALAGSQVIENYPHAHRYLPDCLVLFFSNTSEPIHAVIALDEPNEYILVVTVYRPNEQEWKNDWQTRK